MIDVAIGYDILGMAPDEIVDAHPHLTLPQIHDALSCYYENKSLLDERLDANLEKIKELRKRYPSKLGKHIGAD